MSAIDMLDFKRENHGKDLSGYHRAHTRWRTQSERGKPTLPSSMVTIFENDTLPDGIDYIKRKSRGKDLTQYERAMRTRFIDFGKQGIKRKDRRKDLSDRISDRISSSIAEYFSDWIPHVISDRTYHVVPNTVANRGPDRISASNSISEHRPVVPITIFGS